MAEPGLENAGIAARAGLVARTMRRADAGAIDEHQPIHQVRPAQSERQRHGAAERFREHHARPASGAPLQGRDGEIREFVEEYSREFNRLRREQSMAQAVSRN